MKYVHKVQHNIIYMFNRFRETLCGSILACLEVRTTQGQN